MRGVRIFREIREFKEIREVKEKRESAVYLAQRGPPAGTMTKKSPYQILIKVI